MDLSLAVFDIPELADQLWAFVCEMASFECRVYNRRVNDGMNVRRNVQIAGTQVKEVCSIWRKSFAYTVESYLGRSLRKRVQHYLNTQILSRIMRELRCLDTYINIKTSDSRSRTPPDRSRNSSTFRGHPSSQPRAPLKKHSRERFRKIFSIENHTSVSGNSLANRHKTRPVMVPWRLPTSFNNKQKCKPSALWAAIERWDLKAVSGLLIAQADPEEKHQGWTPLMKASELGSPNIQKLLLDRAADLEAVNKKGRSALSFAVAPSNNIVPCRESIRLLLERRADVFRKDHDGLTAKEHAIKQGRVGAIIICLEQYE